LLIQLYVLRQLLVSVAFSMAGIGLIVMPTVAIQAINKLGAISLTVILQFLPLVLAELVPYLLPMAFLLGVVATYGRLSADREWIAMQMSGLRPGRLALPGLVVAVPLALATDYLMGEASPSWKYLQRVELREAAVERFLVSMRGRNEIYWDKGAMVSRETFENVKRGVQLDQEQADGSTMHIEADEAVLEPADEDGDGTPEVLRIRLKGATVLTENLRADNQSPTIALRLAELFPSTPKDRSKAKYLANSEMRAELASSRLTDAQRQEFTYEIQRRHAFACTYLLFLLLGIPTGVVLRSSTQLGAFTGAVGYAFLYYVLDMRLGKVLAENHALPPVAAAWATNGLFLVLGVAFFRRVLR